MTELVHWMLLSLLELPEFQLLEFKKEPDTTRFKIYLNGQTFHIYVDDLTNAVRAEQTPIKDKV